VKKKNLAQATNDIEPEVQNHSYAIVKPTVTLDDDVILSVATRVQLDEGIAKLRFHKMIYEDWNFGSVDKQGRSVILNFFGAPGTGKTLTAEAFAGSLGLSIIKLGIAELESKFMGETSKNIQAVFKAATEANAVLFFDEADTLLGKRLSSVTQGIDNEVNAMRSTLLIELEKFNGIAIFATNFAKNYDEAFRSRISHHIHFDLPDLEARKNLWSKMLVEQIPLLEERNEFINWAAELSKIFWS
jgi:SpoVK/Ycf46/Vps4 family AAA+-type ATPase